MKLMVSQTKNGKALVAKVSYKKSESILAFERNFVDQPNNMTLRIDENLHQVSTDPHAAENFINHSCEPNAYIDWDGLELRSLRDIIAGEEITYNYFTSDWDGEDVFDCNCGALACKRRINGFKHLPMQEKMKIEHLISPYLKRKLIDLRKKNPAIF